MRIPRSFAFAALCVVVPLPAGAQTLKPYVLGAESTLSLAEAKPQVAAALGADGFSILGEYAPAGDAERWVWVVTSDDLLAAVKTTKGLTAFAATMRVALTGEGGKTLLSYTDPGYWGNAYFRDDYEKVEANLQKVAGPLQSVAKALGGTEGTPFGSAKGLTAEALREYHYMFGMPRFRNTVELAEFASFDEASSTVQENLARTGLDVSKVYSIRIPGENLELWGVALQGEKGESRFLPKIDIAEPKHTAFLPYEFLIIDRKVVMLHGRYRIALSFPDLTMGTFTKIMSTPGDIRDLMQQGIR